MRRPGKRSATVALGFSMVLLVAGCGSATVPGVPMPVDPPAGATPQTPVPAPTPVPVPEPEPQNTPPIEVTASASDATAGVGDVVSLLASVSGGTPDYLYRWTQISGPAGAILTDANKPLARVTFNAAGTFTFSALSQDANGQTAEGTVTITVAGTPAPDSPPSASSDPPASSPNPTPPPQPQPPPPPTFTDFFIFADDGQFLGVLSDNPFDPDSIANPFGTYGNPFSSASIWNDFGIYGSNYSLLSPFSDFTATPPVIVDGTGLFWGYLTTNRFLIPRYDPNDVAVLVGRSEEVRTGF